MQRAAVQQTPTAQRGRIADPIDRLQRGVDLQLLGRGLGRAKGPARRFHQVALDRVDQLAHLPQGRIRRVYDPHGAAGRLGRRLDGRQLRTKLLHGDQPGRIVRSVVDPLQRRQPHAALVELGDRAEQVLLRGEVDTVKAAADPHTKPLARRKGEETRPVTTDPRRNGQRLAATGRH